MNYFTTGIIVHFMHSSASFRLTFRDPILKSAEVNVKMIHAEIANWILPECKFPFFLLGNYFLLVKYEQFIFQNSNLNLLLQ